jgi:heme a synthase
VPAAASRTGSSFARVAAGVLAYTLFVILFGAVVRITGSGAGCGQHWPTCHGEVVHLPQRLETVIELTHRATSGAALLLVIGFAFLAARRFPRGHRVRGAAYASLGMMIVEALIGAALVLFELVGGDASVGRAVVMPLHLVSTYALTAALTLAALWALPAAPPRASEAADFRPAAFLAGALALVLVSATGALTALGDTVAPPTAQNLAGRWLEDHGTSATFLQRLRILHPILAVLTAAGIARHALSFTSSDRPELRAPARLVIGFTGAQLAAGVANVWFSAPGFLQVVHLALAVGLWICFVALAAAARESRPPATARLPAPAALPSS